MKKEKEPAPRKLKDYLPALREIGATCKKYGVYIGSSWQSEGCIIAGARMGDDVTRFYIRDDGSITIVRQTHRRIK